MWDLILKSNFFISEDFLTILFDFSSLPTGTSSKAKFGIDETIVLILACIFFENFLIFQFALLNF